MRLENFFTAYKKQLIDRQKSVEESITSGLCKDWSDYKYLTGKLEGIRLTKAEMQETMKRFEEHE